MRVKGLTWRSAILVALAVFSGSCGGKGPARVTIGGAVRQAAVSYWGERGKILLPVGEVRLMKEITPHLDAQARLQFISQPPMMIPAVMVGEIDSEKIKGNFQSFGLGLNYFPLKSRAIGVELGTEIFRGEYEIEYRVFRLADRFWGGGVNLGVLGEIPLGQREKCRLIWSGGYNFIVSPTEATAQKAGVDLDGWYGALGIKIRL